MGNRQRSGARVVIVDDHEAAREGARRLLSGTLGIEIVGEADCGHAALDICERLRPDMVVVDFHLRDVDGLWIIRELRNMLPDTRLLVLSLFDAQEYLQRSLAAGADEYVLKGGSRGEFLSAVQRCLGQAPSGARRSRLSEATRSA